MNAGQPKEERMSTNYGSDVGSSAPSRSAKKSDADVQHGVDIRKYLSDAKSLTSRLEAQVKARPFVALGAVAGISFVAGSILGNRIGQLAVAIGIGYAATRIAQVNVRSDA